MPTQWSYYEAEVESLDDLDRQVHEALRNQRITEWHLRYMTWRTLNNINYNLVRIVASLETAASQDSAKQIDTDVVTEVEAAIEMSSVETPQPIKKVRPVNTLRSHTLPNARRPWTSEEDTKLRNLHSYGMTDELIAPIFGRTIEAIARRRKLLRLVNINRRHSPLSQTIQFNTGETRNVTR